METFEGQSYYRDKATGYYKTAVNRGPREYLHRAIYSATYGNIPHGWHVHHKDEDTENNTIKNLECMPMREHVHHVHKPPVAFGLCEQCGGEYVNRSHNPVKRFCSHKCAVTWRNRNVA